MTPGQIAIRLYIGMGTPIHNGININISKKYAIDHLNKLFKHKSWPENIEELFEEMVKNDIGGICYQNGHFSISEYIQKIKLESAQQGDAPEPVSDLNHLTKIIPGRVIFDVGLLKMITTKDNIKQKIISEIISSKCNLYFFHDEIECIDITWARRIDKDTFEIVKFPEFEILNKDLYLGDWIIADAIISTSDFSKLSEISINGYMDKFNINFILSSFSDNIEWSYYRRKN
jgi:hypothetical protein